MVGFFLQFRLESNGDQQKLLDYKLTIFFMYPYFRLVVHSITHQVLNSTSRIYAKMPDGLLRDCAFMCVDGPSFFMWVPLTLYLLIVILQEQDHEAVMARIGPLIYVGSVTYQLDRFIHVFNAFRLDRFVHHFLTCVWMLFVLEWTPAKFWDYSFLIFAWTNDICTGRVCYFWVFVARFARRHARQSTTWDIDSSCEGTDRVILPKSLQRLALYGKLVCLHCFLFSFVAAISLEALYLVRYQDEIHIMWKIAVYPMLVFYLCLDKSSWVSYYKFAQESYWMHLLQMNDTNEKDDDKDGSNMGSSDDGTVDWTTMDSSSRAIRIDDILEEPSGFMGTPDGPSQNV